MPDGPFLPIACASIAITHVNVNRARAEAWPPAPPHLAAPKITTVPTLAAPLRSLRTFVILSALLLACWN